MEEQTALMIKYGNDLFTSQITIALAGLATILMIFYATQKGRPLNYSLDTVTNLSNSVSNSVSKSLSSITKTNTVTTKKATAKKATPAKKKTVNEIMKEASKYKYERGTGKTTEAKLLKYGAGDCWAMTDHLFNEFKKNGYKVRAIQYATKYSANHRTVQINLGKGWVDPGYVKNGVNSWFAPTSSKPGLKQLKST